jgi:hypothetical protein
MLTGAGSATVRPVNVARLLERQSSPLPPPVGENSDPALAWQRLLARWMVESQPGRLPLAQIDRNTTPVRQLPVSRRENATCARRIEQDRTAFQQRWRLLPIPVLRLVPAALRHAAPAAPAREKRGLAASFLVRRRAVG